MQGDTNYHRDQDARDERLSAYLDGALDAVERQALERHLATCADCQRALAELRRVRDLLRALPTPALPRAFLLPETETDAVAPRRFQRQAPDGAISIGPYLADSRRSGARTPAPAAPRVWEPRPAWARLSQWAGSVAAVIGLLLLLGATIPGLTPYGVRAVGGGASYGASTANATHSYVPATTTTQVGVAGGPKLHATPGASTPTTTPSVTPTVTYGAATSHTPQSSSPSQEQEQPIPILPVTGTTLLLGGAALFAVGRARTRRRP